VLLENGRKMVTDFITGYFTESQRMPSRLDLLKYSVNQAVKDGLFLEFGVWRGDSLKYLSTIRSDKTFYGFDTFKGLPEDWSTFYPKGHMMLNKPPDIQGNVVLVEGLFQDTLEGFLDDYEDKASFLHLDADLYSSTKFALFMLADYDRLQEGTIIEFDEVFYQDSPNTMLDDEYRVYNEFIEKYDVNVKWLRFFQRRVTTRASLIINRFNGER